MQCLTILLALIASVAAAPSVRRDLAETTTIMTPVLNGLASYDAIVQCYYTGGDSASFKAAGTALLTTVNATIVKAGNMDNLSLADAQGFQPLSDKLNAAGDAVIQHLGDKKPVFELAQMCEYIVPFVGTLSSQVVTMMQIVATKFPAAGQSKDATTISHFEDAFAALNANLADCKDATRSNGYNGFVGFGNGTYVGLTAGQNTSCAAVKGSGSGTATASGSPVSPTVVQVAGAGVNGVSSVSALLVAAAFAAYVF